MKSFLVENLLFQVFRAMPDRTYAFKNDKCSRKFCKDRITVFPGVNMSGKCCILNYFVFSLILYLFFTL